jgi:uncharacterized membrane protein YbaN (DUF454 family)
MNSILKIIGFVLIVIGSIGLFLPFIQGVFFIVIGVYFISRVDKKFEESVLKLLEKGKVKYPKYSKFFKRVEEIYLKLVEWGKKEKKEKQQEKAEAQEENK